MKAENHSDTSSFQQPLLAADPPSPPPQSPQNAAVPPLRRRCAISLAAVLLLASAAYLLWPSDPKLSIVRLHLDRLRFHTRPKISLDATLDLTLSIRNQDLYSLNYDSLLVSIGYRGKQLGHVTSAGGSVKARETSCVNATLQLDRVDILTDVVLLLEDLAKGAVVFDTVSEVSGKIGVYFFLDLPLNTNIECQVVVNTRNQTISRQSCYPDGKVFEV